MPLQGVLNEQSQTAAAVKRASLATSQGWFIRGSDDTVPQAELPTLFPETTTFSPDVSCTSRFGHNQLFLHVTF